MLSVEQINLLQSQNEGLKKQNKELQQENTELKAENERLGKEFKIESLTDKTTGETIYRSNLVNKYRIILQKIKKYIAKICKEECGYVQKKRCPDCDCRYGAILDLITKAEEE